MTLEGSLFPPRSVNILVFLGLVCCWLQPTRKLSENYQFFCIRLSRLGILLLLSTNEPVVVNSCHLYDAKLNFFIPFLWLCIKLYVHPFMKGHGLYMNKTSINLSLSLMLWPVPGILLWKYLSSRFIQLHFILYLFQHLLYKVTCVMNRNSH